MIDFAIKNLQHFFRLIWIEKKDVNSVNFYSKLDYKLSNEDCEQMKHAHVAFFQHFSRLRQSVVFTRKMKDLRIFRD